MDTTFGVVLNWALLTILSHVAQRCKWRSLAIPGEYGHPIQVSVWLKQLLSWIFIIILTKLILAIIIYVLEDPLGHLAQYLFKPLENHPHVELVIVMIACPCGMNAVQFWIQDNFLKSDRGLVPKANAYSDQEKRTILSAMSSDEEEEKTTQLEMI